MAVRRGIAQGIQSASGIVDQYINDLFQRGRLAQQNEYIRQRQIEQGDISLANNWDNLSPSIQQALSTRGMTLPVSSPEVRLGGLTKEIGKANNLNEIITDAELRSQLDALGVGSMPDVVARALEAREQQLAQLKQNEPTSPISYYSDNGGRMMTQYVPQSQLAQHGAFPTEPAPDQRGANELMQFQAGKGSPAWAIAEANVKNLLNEATMASNARFAGAQAGAETSAREHAQMAPDLVNARVDEHLRKAEATASAAIPTQAERTAGSMIIPLMQDHANALAQEQNGARLTIGGVAMANSPFLSATMGRIPGLAMNDAEKNYTNTAIAYASNFTRIMSGVQSREDEFQRFLGNLFAYDTDSPDVIRKKQQNREAYLAAAQMPTGRAGEGTGVALGQMILLGKLDPAIIPTLQFTNPALEDAFAETVSDRFVVSKDDDGRITLTPRAGVR